LSQHRHTGDGRAPGSVAWSSDLADTCQALGAVRAGPRAGV